MSKSPVPSNELLRLHSIADLELNQIGDNALFGSLTRLAAMICEVPIAAFTVVDRDEVVVQGNVGIPATRILREHTFCSTGVLANQPLVIEDARLDARFSALPLVTESGGVRFYAGYPITLRSGATLGMLCVFDREPRVLTPAQHKGLELLAVQLSALLDSLARDRNLRAREHALAQLLARASASSTLVQDLREYLTVIRAASQLTMAEFASKGSTPEQISRRLRQIDETVARIVELAERHDHPVEVSVESVIRTCVELCLLSGQLSSGMFDLDLRVATPIFFLPIELTRLMLNVISYVNANGSGAILIEARESDATYEIRVSNVGVRARELDLSDLSLSREILSANGGTLTPFMHRARLGVRVDLPKMARVM